MKKNDIAIIILIVAVSVMSSYFLGSTIIGEPKRGTVPVEVVEPITATVEKPDPEIFNKEAINPTVVIEIGDPSNKPPFGN